MIVEEPTFHPFPNVDYVIDESVLTVEMVEAGRCAAANWVAVSGVGQITSAGPEFFVEVYLAMRAAEVR